MDIIQKITIWAVPVLFAITLHEVAHGWVARYFGDPTAASLGRLTLNPIRHIDPVGTILVPAIMILMPGNFLFGWAKPVPVNVNQLNNPKRDMAIVAVAGPLSNLVMAFFWALLIKFCISNGGQVTNTEQILILMGLAGITINLVLMVLNMLPLPPLDGGRVLTGVLPDKLAIKFSRIEPYGLIIIIALLVTGILGNIISTPLLYSLAFLGRAVGLPGAELEQYWNLLLS